MARMVGRLFLISILMLAMAGAVVNAAPASQTGALVPAITSFSVDASTVSYADVEAGKAQVTLSWTTINTSAQNKLVLEAFYQNYWVSVLGTGETLPLSGSKQITVAEPQNFGVPTYRLTLEGSQGAPLDQQFVTIQYNPAAQSAPSIVAFTSPTMGIDTNLLVQNNVRLTVSWQIANRQPDTLIRFEQVMPDGSTVSAELPRRMLWVPSSGNGFVVPRVTSSKDDLHFRLSLVGLHDGKVYDQKDLSIPVTGHVMVATSQTASAQTARISTFSAQSTVVPPGGDVNLKWDAGNAASVNVLETVNGGGPTTLYIELPPAGTLNVPLPPDSPGATYTLQAESADGSTTTGKVQVTTKGG